MESGNCGGEEAHSPLPNAQKPNTNREAHVQAGNGTSKALLDLEADSEKHCFSSLEARLSVCTNENLLYSKATKSKDKLPDKKPDISAVPESQVLGKVRDFLGLMAEANKQLENNAEEDSRKYDIEALTGKESEVIEMDLMLGVADLHTPEAVAAAESAITGYPLSLSLGGGSIADSDDSDEESDEHETISKVDGENSLRKKSTDKAEKRRKIEEVS